MKKILIASLFFTSMQLYAYQFNLKTGVTAQNISVVGDFSNWDADLFHLVEGKHGHYQLDLPLLWSENVAYKFVVDGNWINDPTNNQKAPDGFGGLNSIIRTGFKSHPWRECSAKMDLKTRQHLLKDYLGQTRSIQTFVANSSFKNSQNLVMYFNDGDQYVSHGKIHCLLANIARRKPYNILAVFIPARNRMSEYGGEYFEQYKKWLLETVAPYFENKMNFQKRVFIGASLGGLAVLRQGLNSTFPTIVFSQSGSFWYDLNPVLKEVQSADKSQLQVHLAYGRFESDKMRQGNLKVSENLNAQQLLGAVEYPMMHDWPYWSEALARTFESVF